MPRVWLLSLAVFAPLLMGLVTMLWPRRWYRPRVWVAAIGPALAFVLVLSAGVVEHPLGGTGHEKAHAQKDAAAASPLQRAGAEDGNDVGGETDTEGETDTSRFAPGSSLSGGVEGRSSSHPAPGTLNPDPGTRTPDPGSPASELEWIPSLHINVAFFNDGLGVFFALLVAGVGLLIVLYARAYFGQDPDELYRFFPTLGFFTTAMLGVVLSDSFLLTLLFWELTSISSFLLIGWDRYDKRAVKLGMQAFFTTGLGGLALFGGLVLLGKETGIWRWSELMTAVAAGPGRGLEINTALQWSNPYMWGFVLMLVGAGAKSAQFPFHYWLPGAMAAPTPVSAFLHSATMVKAGVFLLGRLLPVLGLASAGTALELWPWVVIPLGAVTMLYGAVVAIQQHDLKRIFAYTTVSQLGLLTCMYGLGSLSYHGAPNLDFDITQIANHAFYKAPLFIVAGALGHVASRNLTELHGAWKKHKAMVLTMLLAGWALAALPGSISFQAKELFVDAVLHSKEALGGWMWVLVAMTLGTAICNVAIFVRLVTTLLGLKGSMAMPQTRVRDKYEQPEIEQAGTGEEEPAPAGHGHAGADAHHGVAHGAHDHHHHETGLWAVMLWLPALLIVSLQYVGGIATPVWNAAFAPLEQIAAGNYIGHKFGGVPDLWQVVTHPGPAMLVSLLAVVGGVMLGYSRQLRGAIVDWADGIYPAMYWLAVTGGG
ncbi:MAG: NADH-quinone oxidoreductase subunit L, partial [Phycisphaeraceae bacterium]